MNTFLWVLQGLLAAVMLMAGAMKLMKGKEKLAEDPRMGWVEDYSDGMVRTIGGLEVAGAFGLVLPWLLDIVPILTPLAAVGLMTVMIGAAQTHRRRNEAIAPVAVLGVIALVIAIGRFAL